MRPETSHGEGTEPRTRPKEPKGLAWKTTRGDLALFETEVLGEEALFETEVLGEEPNKLFLLRTKNRGDLFWGIGNVM